MEKNWSTQRIRVRNPLGAIGACTAPAPNAVGPKMALKSGQPKVGYHAAVLACKEYPLVDIWLPAGAENVSEVRKAGKLPKTPGMRL